MRLIEADALFKFIQDQMEKETGAYTRGKNKAFNIVKSALHNECAAPTIDPETLRPTGRWEPRTDVVGFVRCSVCHDCNVYDDWVDGKKWNYCPNCGAKMTDNKGETDK